MIRTAKDVDSRRTKSLFIEYNTDDPVFTLKREDHRGCLSLYRKYMEIGDITEAEFAEKLFHSFKQWKDISGLWFMKDLIQEWREELREKLHSGLVSSLLQDALNEESKTSTTSAKYLLDNYFRSKGKSAPSQQGTSPQQGREKIKTITDELITDAKNLGILN